MAKILDRDNELRLVREAQSGQAASFGRLYDAYVRRIYDFIYYKTLHRDTAEDIASEVFMKAWKNINQFAGGSFGAWLYRISRNAVIDYYRRQRETLDIEDCWDLADSDDWWQRLDDGIRLGSIRQAMAGLAAEEREIIIMRLWLDLPFKEIASQLGKQEGAIKMAFGRALVRIRKQVPLAAILLFPSLIRLCKTLS